MFSMVTGEYLSRLVNYLFRALLIILKVLEYMLKALNALSVRFIFEPIDRYLTRLAKWLLAKRTKIDENMIVLTTNQGEYTDHVKYISDELIRRKLPYHLVWILRGASLGPYPPELTLIKNDSAGYYKTIAKAKMVIQNAHSLQKEDVKKSKGQIWLQTWHGSLGLKRLEGAGGDERFYRKMRRLDVKQTDYLISNSTFEDNVFSSTYWPGVPSLKLGHARNDILFDKTEETAKHIRKKALKRLRIEDKGQKFLLFAPTHDDNNLNQAFGNLDFDSLIQTLSDKFGGEWEVLVRTHNSNKRQSARWFSGLPLYCHNASFYPDMQELLVLADVGLTDYSSWVCDYILTDKPSFLFGVNVKKYNESRGFYHDIADTPFSMATNNAELLKNIKNFDQKKYEKQIDKFLKDCGSMDDGKAAQRIVDKIEELMEA